MLTITNFYPCPKWLIIYSAQKMWSNCLMCGLLFLYQNQKPFFPRYGTRKIPSFVNTTRFFIYAHYWVSITTKWEQNSKKEIMKFIAEKYENIHISVFIIRIFYIFLYHFLLKFVLFLYSTTIHFWCSSLKKESENKLT